MTLEESIAKFNLGELSIKQFPKIALKVIEQGIESESLLILAGMNSQDNSFEIQQYLDRVIEELNIKVHKSLDAAYVLANSYVNQVISGELRSIESIYKIKNECWDNCQSLIESKEYLYDGIKFEEIIGAWYEYTEIDELTDWVKKSNKTCEQIKSKIEIEIEKLLLNWHNEFLKKKIEVYST